MPSSATTPISARKRPRQLRSTRLVEDVLEAAARVLEREGARRFTTGRVADEAGISIGSLYQYFPNKEAILFKLQADEWTRTSELLIRIIADRTQPPQDRLREMIRRFFQSECEEAALRVALADAAPLYRDAPEALALKAGLTRRLVDFVAEILPHADTVRLAAGTDLVITTMSAIGELISEQARGAADVDVMARAVGDMLCGYLDGVERSAAAAA